MSVDQEVDEVGYPHRPEREVANELQPRVDRANKFCAVDHSNSNVVGIGLTNRVDMKVEE